MNSDKGLGRKLPPVDEHQQEQRDISRNNVLQVRIDANDVLYCDAKQVTLPELQQQAESFLASRMSDQYVTAVETNCHTSYNAYFEMQNAIVAAYRKLNIRPMRIKEGVRNE
jgi:biopolymer transport protein ExbD